MNKEELESIYPLLFFGLIVLVRFLLSKKSKKEDSKQPPPPQKVTPSYHPLPSYHATPTKEPILESAALPQQPEETKRLLHLSPDMHYHKKKTQPRIQKLVARVGRKRNLILLSEILKPPRGIHASACSQNRKASS